MVECECGKELRPDNTYKCRICDICYCEDCSLDHYGLYEDKNGKVKYRNIFVTMLWLLRKRVFGK